MPNRLFIMGMFRSGTTLFARMLHTHDDIVCASDPFRPFFNCLRDDVARDTDVAVDDFAPLDDYYADEEGLTVFDAVQRASLSRDFPDPSRPQLLDKILSHAGPFSPKITDRLDSIQGDTFREVYDTLWTHVPAAYDDGGEQWEATKEVWTTEFTPVLAREYPESKFIHVVRDPRAVSASNNVQEDAKYPWLFLARQWRKLASLSEWYSEQYPDRSLVIRYEDLVQSPRDTAIEVCSFLDLDLDEAILDPSNFVDGRGEQWLQNTSYEGSSASFDTSSVDKWRDVLSDRECKYIEQLCFPEMRLYGYDPEVQTLGFPDRMVFEPPQIPTEQLADWITAYYGDWTQIDHVNAVATEQVRHQLLEAPNETFNTIDKRTTRAFFLKADYANTVRESVES